MKHGKPRGDKVNRLGDEGWSGFAAGSAGRSDPDIGEWHRILREYADNTVLVGCGSVANHGAGAGIDPGGTMQARHPVLVRGFRSRRSAPILPCMDLLVYAA